MNLLIVGYGFVGTATEYLLKDVDCRISIHDPAQEYFYEKEEELDYIFLCVPTDTNPETGKLDTTVLKECYEFWKKHGKVVIRSTIGPDQVKYFPDAIMMPEFLREKHWKEDVDDPELPIIVSDYLLTEIFIEILPFKNTWYLTPKEAMMYKLARNSVLAMRVAMANQLYEICEENAIEYDYIADLLCDEAAIGYSHWNVPGPDGKMGFGGKCLPKDLTHMSTLCYSDSNIMQKALDENEERRK